MSLFEAPSSASAPPLALRLTPQNFDEFSGQESILGPGKLLRRALESDRLGSVVLFGPSGSGKSAVARLIAKRSQARVHSLNAVTAGVAEIRDAIKLAENARRGGQKTILVVDEIHHFNRTQQDALLPHVENGLFTLIGLTTENPYFYVNAALLSRAQVFEFQPLSDKALGEILERALKNTDQGLGRTFVNLAPEAKTHLISHSNGDARRLLNALEIGVLTTPPDKSGVVPFNLAVAEESIQRKALRYDKKGDEHYDVISAFIKSMRGGDPDAAVYWMAKMLEAGDDPRFIARRIVICASEDVGNADPQALILSMAALKAVEFVGMPEGRIPLAQAAIYVACAPKSNASYLAVNAAQEEVRKGPRREVPLPLRDSTLDGKTRGHGQGYRYPHDHPGHWVEQEYMPDPKVFFEPSGQGQETWKKK